MAVVAKSHENQTVDDTDTNPEKQKTGKGTNIFDDEWFGQFM